MIPAAFARTIRAVHGAAGVAWLDQLPALMAEMAQRWHVQVGPPFALSYNFVAPGVRDDGLPVVLKLGIPSPLLEREIAALRIYAGRGAVRLLEAEPARGCLLLERLRPGSLLADLGDDERATGIAAGVMEQLWRPLPGRHPFPDVVEWSSSLRRLRQNFAGGTGPLPARWVATAERLFSELIASSGEPVLIHADLHHFNILAADETAGCGTWLALDPHGVAAEREYEVGALLRNPFAQLPPLTELRTLQARRVDLLAERLGFDRQRVVGWGIAQAVLSACWDLEDHGVGWERALGYAEALAPLLK